jgi:Arc/MetJ-type ribon-helix-helix transcriptional regulator
MTIMGQLVTRIDDNLARAIDQLVEEGVFESRSEAVRKSLSATLDAHRRIRLGRETNEGYRRVPETDDDLRCRSGGDPDGHRRAVG